MADSPDLKQALAILDARVVRYTNILSTLKKSFAILEQVILGLDPQAHAECKVTISKYGSALATMTNRDDSLSMVSANSLFSTMSVINSCIQTLKRTLVDPKYAKYMISSSSSSSYVETKLRNESLTDAIATHMKLSAAESTIVVRDIVEQLNKYDMIDATKVTELVYNSLDVNEFTLYLLRRLLHDGRSSRALDTIVVKQKNLILHARSLGIDYSSSLVRFGLRPITKAAPLADTLRVVGVAGSTLRGISSARVTLINKVVGTPIEFNIEPLIDESYVREHDLITKPTQGLSKKVLARFSTLKLLGPEVRLDLPPIVQFGDVHNSKHVILDTIDGANYRVLANVISSTSYLDGPSTLAQEYNAVHEQRVLTKWQHPHLKSVIDDYKTRPESKHSSSIVIRAVREHLSKWFDQHRDEYTTSSQLRALVISEDTVSQILLRALPVQAPKHGSSIEYLVTYMHKISNIVKVFIIQFGDRWSKERFDAITPQHTSGIFASVVERAVDDLDRLGVWLEYDDSFKLYAMRETQVIL